MNAEDRCFCELAPLYALNLLDDGDRQWVEAQVIANPELAAELAEHETTTNALSYSVPAMPMAADLKDRLFQRLDHTSGIELSEATQAALPEPVAPLTQRDPATAQLPSERTPERTSVVQTTPSRRAPSRRPVIWLQAASAIAALVTIALLVDNYRLRQRAQTDRAIVATLQQPDRTVYTLKGTEKAASASGSLVIDTSHHAAVVLVQNLPALPEGQAYRLWAVPKGATTPTYCGQFNNNRTGTVRWSLPEAVCGATVSQMLITAESAIAPPIPAGPLVMKSAS